MPPPIAGGFLLLAMVLFAHLFALSETGLPFQWPDLLVLLVTTGPANAAAFALNQYYERAADAKMERTRQRPIPSGKMTARTAMLVGLGLFGLCLNGP